MSSAKLKAPNSIRQGVSSHKDKLARVRGVLRRFTTPLLPDDYTQLVNPLWSVRELRGKLVSVEPVTAPSGEAGLVHLAIAPGWGMPVEFHAGQYIGIGVQIDGRYVWRSYSLTNAPAPEDGLLHVTVRAVEKGKLSNHLVGSAKPGMTIRLAAPAGDFHLSNPLPAKLLFVTAGTGITPVISMLRTIDGAIADGTVDVVVVNSVRSAKDLLFGDDLAAFAEKGLELHNWFSGERGRLSPARLAELVPCAQEREIYACGPAELLDQIEAWGAELGATVHTERFTIDRTSTAQGGTITFGTRGERTVDGATTLLEAAEAEGIQLPFGCRMGICQTCVQELDEGYAIDLRSGETKGPGERVRTCVCVAAGDLALKV